MHLEIASREFLTRVLFFSIFLQMDKDVDASGTGFGLANSVKAPHETERMLYTVFFTSLAISSQNIFYRALLCIVNVFGFFIGW